MHYELLWESSENKRKWLHFMYGKKGKFPFLLSSTLFYFILIIWTFFYLILFYNQGEKGK